MQVNGTRPIPAGRLAATAVALAFVAACQEQLSTPVASDYIQGIEAESVIFGMTSFITTQGIREGRVQADTAYLFADSAVAKLLRMQITFYQEDGRERATVTGLSGDWNQDTDQMVARGDVVLLVHADSSRIESQEIYYDPEGDLIWSDSATVRTFKDGTVTSGSSFESDMSFENIRITDPRGGARRAF